MSYNCHILADSISSDKGIRFTTFEVTFPRFILAEVNTHRMLSRNSASSRAIPVAKTIQAVEEDPFVPEVFGKNQPGMQFSEELDQADHLRSAGVWLGAIDDALRAGAQLSEIGVHKSLANRILEPFKWHTAIVSATEWSNFFALRTHPDAQPEFRKIAVMMREAYEESTPRELTAQDWHLPLVDWADLTDGFQRHYPDYEYWRKVSIGRCARVSYLTHDGKRDPEADIALYERLLTSGHLSPFEHVARPFHEVEWHLVEDVRRTIETHTLLSAEHLVSTDHPAYLSRLVEFQGNLRGWHSARMDVPNESDYGEVLRAISG